MALGDKPPLEFFAGSGSRVNDGQTTDWRSLASGTGDAPVEMPRGVTEYRQNNEQADKSRQNRKPE
jgi:hypothetical protein